MTSSLYIFAILRCNECSRQVLLEKKHTHSKYKHWCSVSLLCVFEYNQKWKTNNIEYLNVVMLSLEIIINATQFEYCANSSLYVCKFLQASFDINVISFDIHRKRIFSIKRKYFFPSKPFFVLCFFFWFTIQNCVLSFQKKVLSAS